MDEKKIKIIKIDNDYYLGEGYIEKNSNNFIKNGIGLYSKNYNKTENSSFYFGEWINNKRSGKCYIKNENKDVLIGDFDINGNGKGIYFWFNQKYFFGEFVKEKLSKGFLFSQNIESNDYKLNGTLYYGYFNDEGKKNDKNAIFFDVEKNLMFYGEIENDEMIYGFEIGFDKKENIICAGIDFSEKSKIEKIYFENTLDENVKIGIKDIFSHFYNKYIKENSIIKIIEEFHNFLNQFNYDFNDNDDINIKFEEQLQLIKNSISLIPEFFNIELPNYNLPIFNND